MSYNPLTGLTDCTTNISIKNILNSDAAFEIDNAGNVFLPSNKLIIGSEVGENTNPQVFQATSAKIDNLTVSTISAPNLSVGNLTVSGTFVNPQFTQIADSLIDAQADIATLQQQVGGTNSWLAGPTGTTYTLDTVGIKTTEPRTPFHVNSLSVSGSWQTSQGIRAGSGGPTGQYVQMGYSTDTGGWIQSFQNGPAGEAQGTYKPTFINPSGGAVAIGSYYPDNNFKLDINGATKMRGGLTIDTGDFFYKGFLMDGALTKAFGIPSPGYYSPTPVVHSFTIIPKTTTEFEGVGKIIFTIRTRSTKAYYHEFLVHLHGQLNPVLTITTLNTQTYGPFTVTFSYSGATVSYSVVTSGSWSQFHLITRVQAVAIGDIMAV